jgi:hypothetical protein
MADSTDYVVLKEVPFTGSFEELKALVEKGSGRIWVEVDGKVAADRNTDAIKKATKDWSDDDKRGNYAAPSARNFPVIPRDVTTKVVDEFGEPSTAGTRQRRKAPEAPAGE